MLKGVRQVVRFNWPYYAGACGLVLAALVLDGQAIPLPLSRVLQGLAVLVGLAVLASLLATAWVYDFSPLYRLDWLSRFAAARSVAVFTAGFDEISEVVRNRLPAAVVETFDFHPREARAEASIERARAKELRSGIPIAPRKVPLADRSLDLAIVFMAAHEIRSHGERIGLFAELGRCLRESGRGIVVEHERDLANCLAYTLGALHFLPAKEWLATFAGAGLRVVERTGQTPFVTVYELARREAGGAMDRRS